MHFFLNAFDVREGDLGIFDNEDGTGFAVLVDAEKTGGKLLGVGLADDFFALQHGGENEAGVLGVGLVIFDELGEEGFGVVGGDLRFFFFDGRLVMGAPEGEGLGNVFASVPGGDGIIQPDITGGFGIGEDGGDEGLVFLESFAGEVAAVGAGLDGVVFDHG